MSLHHTLTREVEVAEQYVVRPLYQANRDTLMSTGFNGPIVDEADKPVWERKHETYASAVDAGLSMIAHFPLLDGFTIDRLFVTVQTIEGTA